MKTSKHLFILAVIFSVYFGFGQADSVSVFEIYGFAQMDMGYNTGQINPSWYDVSRPSKLPSFKNEFNSNGHNYLSARQSRLGFKSSHVTKLGELKTQFDIDMFGVGADAGQTTIRLRHAYGQLGHFGAGQTESAFMDLDVFPNTLEYWGPCGMLFFRNVQFRWIPILGATHLMFALEMPGASADGGIYTGRNELSNMSGRFPIPDLSGHYRLARKWGYVQLGGMLRYMEWVDNSNTPGINLSGNDIGWGASLSSNIKFGKKDVLRLQGVYGEGIQNYFNDAPVDVGVQNNFNNPAKPIIGVALPVVGIVAFLDHQWNDKFSSSIGYSSTEYTNSDGQAPSAFKKGQYIAANLIYYPIDNVLVGLEGVYIDRANKSDGFTSSNMRINISFKYNFGIKLSNK